MSSKVNMNMHEQNKESGLVAIFTVVFFILLISVLTLGFLRAMIVEQQQTTNDDLTKGGLAAAEAGVEDAKRAILAYNQSTGAMRSAYDAAFSSTSCPGIFGNASVRSDLGLSTDPAGGIQVSNQQQLRQRHTCVTLQMNTDDYLGTSRIGGRGTDSAQIDGQLRPC
jgi:Tfp pilus assembly protein PilX